MADGRGGPGAARGPAGVRRSDRGQTAVEYVGMLPLLVLVGLAVVQLGLAAYAVQQAGTASRAAARTASHDDPGTTPERAGRAAVSDWLADGADVRLWSRTGDEVRATATVRIPSLLPGVSLGRAERTTTMPRDPQHRTTGHHEEDGP